MTEILSNQEALMAIVNALNGVKDILWWVALWLFFDLLLK